MVGVERTVPIVTTVTNTAHYSFIPYVTDMADSVMTTVVITITIMTTSGEPFDIRFTIGSHY